MEDPKSASTAGVEDAEVFVSASEDDSTPQVVTPELLSALVKQVEFYFSDANLPTDKKLLKQIRKDSEGFVPVKLFANFRKVRALSKDVGIITEALRSTSLLQLSQDGKRVRRLVPVPEYDISDIQRRTIVVENLPGNPSPTIESVTEMFRVYGKVKLVRICSRESKGKLPSWLTSSCQHMGGTQHAYVEFEEQEGAILASAALAQDADAPDGVVQVRRLLACIAEQRERRSVTGAGSSFGGSSGGGSRKGSRDVSPMGNRNLNTRRGSSGGAPMYGSNAYSCGGSTWASSSSGGAPPDTDAYHPAFHPYRSYGGAFEYSPASRSGSCGGAGPSPPLSVYLPPPPPPPRRSCDSAPPSDLSAAAAVASSAQAPASAPPLMSNSRSANAYRPPGKRLSDGYHCGFQPPPVMVPSPGVGLGTSPLALQRGLGTSFGSSCGTGTGSNASTPTAALSSPSPLIASCMNLAANSPPLATRGASGGGGRPPVHPAVLPLPPPPPPPPPKPQQSAVDSHANGIAAALVLQHPACMPQSLPPSPSATGLATQLPNALAEAIALVQAERRSSEAGAAKVVAATLMAEPGAASATVPMPAPQAIQTAAIRTVLTAPKFCLDLAGLQPTRGSRGAATSYDGGLQTLQTNSADATPKVVPVPLQRASQTQMVANVQDFINNILAGRPAPRSAQVSGSAATFNNAGAQQRKATGAAPSTMLCVSAPSQQNHQPALDAAVTVAGILASTLRRSNATTATAPPVSAPTAPAASSAVCGTTPVKPATASVGVVAASESPSVVPERSTHAPTVDLPPFPTTVDDFPIAGLDIALEHAVTVTVHRSSNSAMASSDSCSKKVIAAAATSDESTLLSYSSFSNGGGVVSSAISSPPSSPNKMVGKNNGGAKGMPATSAGRGSSTGAQLSSKRLSRRDYAQWAAATPEFRAEAASKYAPPSASGSPSSIVGGFCRSSGGGAAPSSGCGTASPPSILGVSISDGGVFGTAVSSGASSSGGGSGYHHVLGSAAPIWHVAKGPDGSKGFAGRSRALAV